MRNRHKPVIKNRRKQRRVTSTEHQYHMQVQVMNGDETREYHLKKFAEWGEKWEEECKEELVFGVDGNIYRNGKLLAEDPSYYQKQWFVHRMNEPDKSWKRWYE